MYYLQTMKTLREWTPIGQILVVAKAETEKLAIDGMYPFKTATLVVKEGTQRRGYRMESSLTEYTNQFPVLGRYIDSDSIDLDRMFHATVLGLIMDNGQKRLLYATAVEPYVVTEPLAVTPMIRSVSTVSLDDVIEFQELVPKQ